MKNCTLKTCLLVCATVMSLSSSYAQEYKNSVGVVAGMLNGLSYKHLSGHFAAQTDLGIGIDYAPCGYDQILSAWDFRFNQNFAYQGTLYAGAYGHLNGFGGFGVSLGELNSYRDNVCVGGVFGVNALLGIEYAVASSPVAFGLDFRPGYGLYFGKGYVYDHHSSYTVWNNISAFDWRLCISCRYCF